MKKSFRSLGGIGIDRKPYFFLGGGGFITTFYDKIHAVHLNVRSV